MIALTAPKLGFHGGVERYVYDLARGLRTRGHRVVLVHGTLRGRDADRYREAFDAIAPMGREASVLQGVEVIYLHKAGELAWLSQVASGRRVHIAVHDHDATCVRSHRYLPVSHAPCGLTPGIACALHGCTLVRTRGAAPGLALRNPYRLLQHTRALAAHGMLVAGSAYLRMTLLQAGVPPACTTVIHPVPPEDPRPLVPAPRQPVVAFIGQIIRGKGLDLLLRAVARQPEVQVLVAGEGTGRQGAESLVRKLGLQQRVEFLGAVGPEAVTAVYDQARIVVVPSRWPEPFGMVGIEAMRRERPVVGAWHGGIPEWLDDGESGRGFRPGDVEDLVHAMQSVLYARDYERMAQRAAASVRARFSYDAMIEQVERVLGISHACGTTASDECRPVEARTFLPGREPMHP